MIGAAVHAMDHAKKVPTNFLIAQPLLASLLDVDETYTPQLAEFGTRADLLVSEKQTVEEVLAQMAASPMGAKVFGFRDKDGDLRV